MRVELWLQVMAGSSHRGFALSAMVGIRRARQMFESPFLATSDGSTHRELRRLLEAERT